MYTYRVVHEEALMTVPFLCSTTWELCWSKQGLSSSEQHMSCLFLRHKFLLEQLEAFPQLHTHTQKDMTQYTNTFALRFAHYYLLFFTVHIVLCSF